MTEIQKKLARFQELWDESLNGYYKNSTELSNLARQIRDAKCNDEFLLSSLNIAEKNAYRCAVILANAR